MAAVVHTVVWQHAENATSLWLQRQLAVGEPHYDFNDLVHLENRLDANLDGLRVAGDHAVAIVDEMVEAADEGAVFVRALLALEAGDQPVFDALIEQAGSRDEIVTELASALAWIEPNRLKSVVKGLLEQTQVTAIRLGLHACRAHGRDPGRVLHDALRHDDPALRADALCMLGESGRRDRIDWLPLARDEDDARVRFHRARAHLLLGDHATGQELLGTQAVGDSALNAEATALLAVASAPGEARQLLKRLDGAGGRERDVIRGFGLIGDPQCVPWLIERAGQPAVARLCGEAIAMITGVDLADADLERLDAPGGVEGAGPSDDADDDDVSLDPDDHLPWPDTTRLADWWAGQRQWHVGTRYLVGREHDVDNYRRLLREGRQRQRTVAAMALAIAAPGEPYRDTHQPTRLQRQWLG